MAYWTIIGTANSGTPKNFGVTLDTDNDTWVVGGPAAARLFITKFGKYDMHVLPTIGTTLLKENNGVVVIFDGLNGTSNVGDTGTGKMEETANLFTWKLDSK